MEKWRATLVRCKAACREPARTLDGQLVSVEANIGIHDDAELALDNGADGGPYSPLAPPSSGLMINWKSQ